MQVFLGARLGSQRGRGGGAGPGGSSRECVAILVGSHLSPEPHLPRRSRVSDEIKALLTPHKRAITVGEIDLSSNEFSS